MVVTGYCRLCHRVKRIRVAIVRSGAVPVGECSDCTEGHRCDNYVECRGLQATHQGSGRWLCTRCLLADRRAQRLNQMQRRREERG